jgi:SSS family transporter
VFALLLTLLAQAGAPASAGAPRLQVPEGPPVAVEALAGAAAGRIGSREVILGGALGRSAWVETAGSEGWREVTLPFEPGWSPLLLAESDALLVLGGRPQPDRPHRPVAAELRLVGDEIVVTQAPQLPCEADELAAATADGWRLLWCWRRESASGDAIGSVTLHAAGAGAGRAWEPQVLPTGAAPGPAALDAVRNEDGSPGFVLLARQLGGPGAGLWRGFFPHRTEWRSAAAPPAVLAAPWSQPFGPSHLLVGSRDAADVLAWHALTDTWVSAGALPVPPGDGPLRFIATRTSGTSSLGILDAVILLGYLALVLAIGARFAGREKGSDDWFVAGRRIPAWAAGCSILATQISAITFLSTPAVAFATDWSLLPSWFGMLLFAPIAIFVFLPLFRRMRAPTAYSWLEERFGLPVRHFGAASFLVFQLARMGVVTYLPALAIAHATGLPHEACILICGAVAILYTVLGGMEAVVWTDVLQTFAIFGGAPAAIVVLVADAGGPGAVWSEVSAAGKARVWNPSWSVLTDAGWLVLLGGWFLQFGPYSADQAIVQRYLSTPDEKSAARAIWMNGWLSAPVGFLFLVVGAGLWAWFRMHPERLEIGMTNDEVFPLFLMQGLPPGVGGLILAALAAAAMSTLDSGMHSCATVATHDFWLRLRRTPPADDAVLRTARRFTFAAGVVATGIALALAAGEVRSLLLFFLKVLGLVMSGVAGVFTLGVLVRRAGTAAALAGAAACTLLLAWLAFATSVHLFLYPLAGIPTCVAVGWLASRIAPRDYQRRDLRSHSVSSSN